MARPDQILREAIFGRSGSVRFTLDSPVLPEVWWAFVQPTADGLDAAPEQRVSLLLTPYRGVRTAELLQAIQLQFAPPGAPAIPLPDDLAYNEAYLKGAFTFEDLLCRLLPLTRWYQEYLWRNGLRADLQPTPRERAALRQALRYPPGSERDTDPVPADLVWLVRCAGCLALAQRDALDFVPPWDAVGPAADEAADRIIDVLTDFLQRTVRPNPLRRLLWRVNRNRTGVLAVWRSRVTVKADAADRTYQIDCSRLRWAVIDSGIDARHPAFRRRAADGTPLAEPSAVDAQCSVASQTRVVATYDFGRLTELLRAPAVRPAQAAAPDARDASLEVAVEATRRDREIAARAGQPGRSSLTVDERTELRQRLLAGRMVAWDLLEPLLRVADADYEAPSGRGEPDHGTHVAGILAADWRKQEQAPGAEHDVQGVCPSLELVDIRVRDRGGNWDEFTVITALQFVRFLNQAADRPVIQGVNLSLQFPADPASYAAGHTPICEECDRLVSSGVVVVVAAGNSGFEYRLTGQSTGMGLPQPWFWNICIGDPGTAESVITVGATHRESPHTYGVSYFSSRGPTADGRMKPDLLAPGEKIVAPVPNSGLMAMDGTSMAAPHVSGAAALSMARNPEYIGRPGEVKRVLMATATDLGRDRNFQGAGLLDIMRALGSV